MSDPLAAYESAPFPGPFAIYSMLADKIVTANLPYEGPWVPVKWADDATIEVTGANLGTLQADLFGTNQQSPTNTYGVTVSGSVTTGDQLNLTFNGQNLPSAGVEVSYTTVGGDTDSTIAAGLSAAINANAALLAIGVIASVNAAVITVNWPSASNAPPTSGYTPSSPPPLNTILLTASKSVGASETLTIAAGSDGTNLTASHISAVGLTAVSPMPVRFVKIRVTELTGGGALSVALAAVAP